MNPDDPAILVEKRFGIGYTLNFGRPLAWLVLAAIFGAVAVAVIIGFLSVHPH